MGYIIEISESDMEYIADNIANVLQCSGKVMQYIDRKREECHHGGGRMGYRDEESHGYSRGGRYGMREDDREWDDDREREDDYMGERHGMRDWDDMPPYMGERRGRSPHTGRYMRR